MHGGHAHDHHDGHHHAHHHAHEGGHHAQERRLAATLALVLAYMVAELVGGMLANSLALLADAAHMLADAGALVIALIAMRVARRPPTRRHTFGYQRAEILAALVNGAALLAISGYIFYEAYHRVMAPPAVRGELMLGVAAGGLLINLAGLWLLHGGKKDNLNVRGAWLHVLSDSLGSAGAIVAGVCIAAFGWTWADPVASLAIGLLLLYSSWSLLKETAAVLMQAVPSYIDVEEIEAALLAVAGVRDVHDLHVWSVTSGRDILSAHIAVDADAERDRIAAEVHGVLRARFDIHHSTIQVETEVAGCQPCEPSRPVR